MEHATVDQTPQVKPSQRVTQVALKAFFNLAEAWELKNDQARNLLGNPSKTTFHRWKAGDVGSVPNDTIERISVLLGIYKATHILLPIKSRANAYVKKANSAFDNRSALEVMLGGRVDNLYQVRRHLDAHRG